MKSHGAAMKIRLNKAYKKAKFSKARYRILYGGAGSGKSHFVAQETILNMISDERFHYLAVRKTARSIRNSIFRLICDLISDYDLTSYFSINKTEMAVTCINGATLITSGLDDVEKLKSIANINRIWVEEASEITENDFNQLDLRLRGLSGLGYQLTLTFNPISELHWLKRSFFDLGRPGSFVMKTTYKDNEFLDNSYIKTLMELEKQDYQYYRIYALGDWGSLGNLIFTNWEKQEFDHSTFDNYFNGLDWGFADDPTAFIRVHYDKKRKTIYVVNEFCKRSEFVDEIAGELHDLIGRETITCDSSEPRSIADIKRHGIRAIAAKKGPGSVEHGVKWLQSHKIIVHPQCIETIKELTAYKWREDKDGNVIPKPVDINNHLIDALRYALENEMIARKGLSILK